MQNFHSKFLLKRYEENELSKNYYPVTENPEPPTTEKCDGQYSDFDKFKEGCYKWVANPAPWLEAEQICQEMDGSHLVSILSESEEALALISIQNEAAAAWIGLTDAGHSGLYKWSDGWPMQISNWGQPPVSGQTFSSCISQNTTDGKWY